MTDPTYTESLSLLELGGIIPYQPLPDRDRLPLVVHADPDRQQ
jgi:hypothetical protein